MRDFCESFYNMADFVVTYSMISISFFTELLLNSVLAPMIFKITSCFNRYIALDITRGDF